jgi:uncharacterized membrane protein YgdD (TMEM256/DUF423 family)
VKAVLSTAFFLLGLGVACGAFGAHGLREYFVAREEEIWKTAVFYQLIHALGLILLVLSEKSQLISTRTISLCSKAMIFGIIVFSGSLYLLVLTRQSWLGAITPIGGVLLIGSWVVLAWVASRGKYEK